MITWASRKPSGSTSGWTMIRSSNIAATDSIVTTMSDDTSSAPAHTATKRAPRQGARSLPSRAKKIARPKDALVGPLDGQRDGVAAAEAKRRETGPGPAILHGVQQRRQHARAARADGVSERDRAAVHVHAVPFPAEALPVRERLRCECLVRFDEIVIPDLCSAFLHELLDGDDRGEEEVLRLPAARRVTGDS